MHAFDTIENINKKMSLKKLYLFDLLYYYLQYNNVDSQDICHYI